MATRGHERLSNGSPRYTGDCRRLHILVVRRLIYCFLVFGNPSRSFLRDITRSRFKSAAARSHVTCHGRRLERKQELILSSLQQLSVSAASIVKIDEFMSRNVLLGRGGVIPSDF